MKTIATIIGFTIGNFLIQFITRNDDWEYAFKVSFYQTAVIIYCWHIAD